MTLLAEVVAASAAVGATTARSAKTAALADLLRRLEPDEVPVAVGFLTGVPRQGRVGIGYATVYGVQAEPASEPSLTIGDVDAAVSAVQALTGKGSAGARREA